MQPTEKSMASPKKTTSVCFENKMTFVQYVNVIKDINVSLLTTHINPGVFAVCFASSVTEGWDDSSILPGDSDAQQNT